MIIQLHGVGFHNKGAELMMHAIAQEIYAHYDNAVVCMKLNVGSYQQRSEANLHHLITITGKYRKYYPLLAQSINRGMNILPASMRHLGHVVNQEEVDVVFDASGFAFSDQWGPKPSEKMVNSIKHWKARGIKIVLMPQAFGPFENQEVRKAIQFILNHVDLVFAREQISYDYLVALDARTDHIRIAPDFTNLLHGQIPNYFEPDIHQACIIPNYRMVDKIDDHDKNIYIRFLLKSTYYLKHKNIEPFFLIHATRKGDDFKLAKMIQDFMENPPPIITEENPFYLKGLIKSSKLVISSRFHGLVSSLSQNRLSLGTGWSHKYQMLFNDYNCPECLISLNAEDHVIFQKIDMMIKKPYRHKIQTKLEKASEIQKKRVREMWYIIHEYLSIKDIE